MQDREKLRKVLEMYYLADLLDQDAFPEKIVNTENAYSRVITPKDHEYGLPLDAYIPRKKDRFPTDVTFYAGCLNRDRCLSVILDLLRRPNDIPEDPEGKITIFSFRANRDGIIGSSVSVSPVVWMLSCLKNDSVPSKSGYDLFSKQIRNASSFICSDIFHKTDEEKLHTEGLTAGFPAEDTEDEILEYSYPVSSYINRMFERVTEELPAGLEKSADKVVYLGAFYGRRKGGAKDAVPRMGMQFFANDIGVLLADPDRLSKTDMGRSLSDYLLRKDDKANKTDLLDPAADRYSLLRTYCEITDPHNAPAGKWPSAFSPSFMQQLAVDLAVNSSGKEYDQHGKIFSVNGPPGTGKTTILKEIIVDRIVKKAVFAATHFEDPDDAFERCADFGRMNGGKPLCKWGRMKKDADEFNEYSILVASSNNTAVENISKELPLFKDISSQLSMFAKEPEYKDKAEEIIRLFSPENDLYFQNLSEDLLSGRGENSRKTWGLVSAALGKSENRKNFSEAVLKKFLADKHEISLTEYRSACRALLTQKALVDSMRDELSKNSEAVILYGTACRKKEQAVMERTQLPSREEILKKGKEEYLPMLELLRKEIRSCEEETGRIRTDILIIKEELRMKESRRGTFGKILSVIGTAAGIRSSLEEDMAKDEAMLDELSEKAERSRNLLRSYEEMGADAYSENACRNIIAETEEKRRLLNRQEAEYDRIIASYKGSSHTDYALNGCLNEPFIADLFGKGCDSRKAHSVSPWSTKEYDLERMKLFALSMKTLACFIKASRQIQNNMNALYHMWMHGLSFPDDPGIYTELMKTLFLFVPVISTTFSSVGSMFGNLVEPGTYGTLIVDEAGQAVPHMAIGALYRARSAVIVGDPRQLQPVIKDDLRMLLLSFARDQDLLPYVEDRDASVQTYADRINRYGSFIRDEEGAVWVGCPLVLHRRCLPEILEVSNQVSYGGMIQCMTSEPSGKWFQRLPDDYRTRWFNVRAPENGNKDHFCAKQARVVANILYGIKKQLGGEGEYFRKVFLITPFKSVECGLKKEMQKWRKEIGLPDGWENANIGTVHTFQGKEADMVFFILGCDDSPGAEGAIRWVNANLVNVAVSRAKYRLIVIGDKNAWKKNKYVKKMQDILP